jgi:hypothetical protein
MARRLLDGDALAAFDRAAAQLEEESAENFQVSLNALAAHIFPQRALRTQKRYMRRFMRKKPDISIRTYVARVNEINAMLDEFPPHFANQALPEDEILDILEFGIPATWQKIMTVQGFDPQAHTIQEFVEFCERLEFTEDTYTATRDTNTGTRSKTGQNDQSTGALLHAKSSARGEKRKRESREDEREKWCDLHHKNTHNTADCKVVQAQIKRMRSQWEAQPHERRSQKGKEKGEGRDLHLLVENAVKKAMKQLQTEIGKRKCEKNDDDTVSDHFTTELEHLSLSDADEQDDE